MRSRCVRAMSGTIGVALAFVTMATAVRAQSGFAITHVSVIDGRDSVVRGDQTVVVRGNRIVTVGPSAAVGVPGSMRTIDGRGKFLIPGLWDMHVHLSVPGGRDLLGLYIANGVTGVRSMADTFDLVQRWRREILAGKLVGPRIVTSGPYIEGGEVPIPHLLARNPAEARIAVDSLVALGVDFVKVHGQIKPDTYNAIARRARERGIAFAGHVPRTIGAASASDSGQRSIEHLLGIPLPCTLEETLALEHRFVVQAALGTCSLENLAPLYATLVRNNTWVTPTMVAAAEIAAWPGRAVPGDTVARFLPRALREFVADLFPLPDDVKPGADSVGRAVLQKRMAQVETMRRAGVHILTGTDAPLRNSPPGFGLLEEFVMLSRGGMSPFHVLRAATWEPANYFNMLDSLGTIAEGKLADLVLLNANPLLDVRNFARIEMVVANGRVFDGKARAILLAAPTRRERH